jgi:hypothetical protein
MIKVLLIASIFFGAANSFAQDSFMGGYCSAYNENGEWAVSYGPQQAGFHCALVHQELVGLGAAIEEDVSGWFDRYDMNQVKVNCLDEETSFQLDGFGERVIARAVRQVKSLEKTHCLFVVRPHFDYNQE